MKRTKAAGGRSYAGVPRRLSLPRVILALVEIAALDHRYELLRRAEIIRVVGLAATGEGDLRAVVKIVVPERVEAVAPFVSRPREARVLRLVLGDDDCPPRSRPPPSRRAVTRAMMCSADASWMAWVASSRRPSRWNSSIQ